MLNARNNKVASTYQSDSRRSVGSRGLAVFSGLLLSAFASFSFAADADKNPGEQNSRSGQQIEQVISDSKRAPTLELLQEGFVIECSTRFEGGCKLFLSN